MNLKVIKDQLVGTAIKVIRDHISTIHGPKADICIVWGYKGKIWFETSFTHGELAAKTKINYLIRKQCGENILNLAGVPSSLPETPKLFLLPFPSIIKETGLKKYLQLLRDWPGDSTVNNIPVIQYFNLF